jgi:hypothetical protein
MASVSRAGIGCRRADHELRHRHYLRPLRAPAGLTYLPYAAKYRNDLQTKGVENEGHARADGARRETHWKCRRADISNLAIVHLECGSLLPLLRCPPRLPEQPPSATTATAESLLRTAKPPPRRMTLRPNDRLGASAAIAKAAASRRTPRYRHANFGRPFSPHPHKTLGKLRHLGASRFC